MKHRVTHTMGWFLIVWAIASAFATPFVGRFVSERLNDVESASMDLTQGHATEAAHTPDAS